MILSGDTLRPNRLKPGDLVLHFIGNGREVKFIVLAYIEDLLVDGDEMALATESLVNIMPYENFLN